MAEMAETLALMASLRSSSVGSTPSMVQVEVMPISAQWILILPNMLTTASLSAGSMFS
jgi:hypothetical protein